MADPTTNGDAAAFDMVAARMALMSSSTSTRMTQLRAIDDKIAHKGALSYPSSPACILARRGHARVLRPMLGRYPARPTATYLWRSERKM
ncbi:hypothetical protein IMZ48_18885 [Candidatus Bathyarchaeota archaeon]|nr:hypothetical protein [Candidatus Bathyarchaeota archaeon]